MQRNYFLCTHLCYYCNIIQFSKKETTRIGPLLHGGVSKVDLW